MTLVTGPNHARHRIAALLRVLLNVNGSGWGLALYKTPHLIDLSCFNAPHLDPARGGTTSFNDAFVHRREAGRFFQFSAYRVGPYMEDPGNIADLTAISRHLDHLSLHLRQAPWIRTLPQVG